MSLRRRSAWVSCLVIVSWLPAARDVAGDEPEGLRISKPVVCTKILGFADIEPLPEATLTADDKLTIYYEPSGYTIERTKDGFRAMFAQDGRIRKKGGRDSLWKKAPMFEYEAKSETPPYRVYMRSDLSIKGLPPVEYEIDLTLHDRLAKGMSAMRTVAFKVVLPKEGGGRRRGEGEEQEAECGSEEIGVKRRVVGRLGPPSAWPISLSILKLPAGPTSFQQAWKIGRLRKDASGQGWHPARVPWGRSP